MAGLLAAFSRPSEADPDSVAGPSEVKRKKIPKVAVYVSGATVRPSIPSDTVNGRRTGWYLVRNHPRSHCPYHPLCPSGGPSSSSTTGIQIESESTTQASFNNNSNE